jgi:hypothetical protein
MQTSSAILTAKSVGVLVGVHGNNAPVYGQHRDVQAGASQVHHHAALQGASRAIRTRFVSAVRDGHGSWLSQDL